MLLLSWYLRGCSFFLAFFKLFQLCNHLAACFALIVFLLSRDCYSSVSLPRGAVGLSVACECGISMGGSRGGAGGPDPPGKSQKYRVSLQY